MKTLTGAAVALLLALPGVPGAAAGDEAPGGLAADLDMIGDFVTESCKALGKGGRMKLALERPANEGGGHITISFKCGSGKAGGRGGKDAKGKGKSKGREATKGEKG